MFCNASNLSIGNRSGFGAIEIWIIPIGQLGLDSKWGCLFSYWKVKSKTITSSSKTTTKATTSTAKVREKKVFNLAGQKHDPPEEVCMFFSFFVFSLCY